MLSFARRTVVETLENSDKDVCDRDDGTVRFIFTAVIHQATINCCDSFFLFLFHLYLFRGGPIGSEIFIELSSKIHKSKPKQFQKECAENHEKVSQHLTEAVIDDSDGFANDICCC